jgi:hypothetical protein
MINIEARLSISSFTSTKFLGSVIEAYCIFASKDSFSCNVLIIEKDEIKSIIERRNPTMHFIGSFERRLVILAVCPSAAVVQGRLRGQIFSVYPSKLYCAVFHTFDCARVFLLLN